MNDIGNILKKLRIKKGYTLDYINHHTKIRLHIIEAIEDERYDILPAVYMKAFISDYMKFMDLDSKIEEVINEIFPKSEKELLANETAKKHIYNDVKVDYDKLFSTKRKKKDFFNKTSILMYSLYGLVLIAILIILYFAFFKNDKNIEVKNSPANNESTQVVADESLLDNSNIAPEDSMSLRIISKDTVWLRLSNDGKNNKQTVLYPGNTLEMRAWEYFTISTDKASHLDIYRDGSILPKLNKEGNAVRNVKITRSDIVSPTSVYSDSTIKVRRIKKKEQEKKKEKPYILSPSIVN